MTGTGNRRALLAAALPPRTHRVMARYEAIQAASRCEEARRSNLDREFASTYYAYLLYCIL